MKLRNKKTGERGIINYFDNQSIVIYPIDENWNAKGDKKYIFHSLAELNEEWEDMPEEEPKIFWYIEPNGVIARIDEWDCCTDSDIEIMKTLGNYFETEEEAEKAVKKLTAWKRLKEAGFEFGGWTHTPITKSLTGYNLHIKAYSDKLADYMDDLQLLFGGEE